MNLKKQKSAKLIKNYFVVIMLGIFVFSLALRLLTINQIGRTWDEFLYVEQGHKMIELIRQGDLDNSFFYTTYDHPPLVKYLYGIAAQYDVKEYAADGNTILYYDLTHARLLSIIIFSLGVLFVSFIGWRMFSPLIGIMAGFILTMMPFSLGLSQLVSTESWKIFIYPLAIYSYILLLRNYSIKKVLLAGIITGVALQIKQSNLLLLFIFAAMYISYFHQFKEKQKLQFINNKSRSIIIVGFISIVVFFLFWPQALLHFQDIQSLHSHYWDVKFSPKPWQITLSQPEIFFGQLMLTPVFYYVVYFFISIPVIILVLFTIGFRSIFKKKDWVYFSLLFWFLIPFIMSFYSWRQHGLRYIIEIYPAIALIAAIGFNTFISRITKNEGKKFLFFLSIIIYLLLSLMQIKPYYLDYFNELVGGTNTVYKYQFFQQGWWGQGMRDAGLYINKNAINKSKIGLAVSPEHVLPKSEKLIYEKWTPEKEYDFVVVNYYHIIRDGFDDSLIRENYDLVYEVKADEAILVFIYKKK